MKNAELAAQFNKTADILALLNENTFRVLAYRKIARALEELAQDVEVLAKEGKLETVPGIGKSSAEKIGEYLREGTIAEFEEIWSQVPHGVTAVMNIPTVGAKTAAILWHEAGVTSIEDLKAKIEAGQINGIKGIGEKKLQKILQNIQHLSVNTGRVRVGQAMPIAEAFVTFLEGLPGVEKACYAGSLRRGKETIGDVDLLVAGAEANWEAIGKAFASHHLVLEVIAAGDTKTSIRTAKGLQVDLRCVPVESWGAALQYFTGSKEHNVRLRQIAINKGMKLNEWGLFKGETMVDGGTEESLYGALGMAWVPPEMREDKGEVEWAQKNLRAKQPHVWEVLEIKDIRGELHSHTVASDGSRTIEEMVAEAKRRGLEYLAITDHSKSQFQANGLKTERLLEHAAAVKAVAKEAKGILVLAGTEVDILADGSLDYEDEALAKLDWVVASPHAALTQDSEAATRRLVRAAANPYVCVIGHPTGRLVPNRRGLEPDMQQVVFAAARGGIALEINANSHRLDLRDSHVRLAVDAGVPICIDTDAHDYSDFDELVYGVLTARRGWATKANVLNARPAAAFKAWMKERKALAGW